MSWHHGNDILREVLDIVLVELPESSKPIVIERLIEVFEAYDAEDLHELRQDYPEVEEYYSQFDEEEDEDEDE